MSILYHIQTQKCTKKKRHFRAAFPPLYMPLYLLLTSLYYPLCLSDGQLKMLREGLEFLTVEPSSLEDLAPLPIMDALIDKPRPLRAREISQIVCLH